MVILGIFLEAGEKEETRNLKLNEWFPFGNIQNIHDILHNNKDELKKIKNKVADNHLFINKFYNSFTPIKEDDFNINISTVVGKNGSGKSTLLSLYYRIINNFNCKINQLYPDLNEHKTEWAYGFNATLYYELKGEIFSIRIYNNLSNNYIDKENFPVKFLDEKGQDLFENITNTNNNFYLYLKEHFFYTISENYSIYPTTFSNFGIDNKISNEVWEDQLYHKNDGYLTPIVLVPFKDENMIDIGKESKLAAERVATLSLQLKLNKSYFIEDYEPERINYKLIHRKKYEEDLKEKLNNSYKYYLNKKEENGINIDNKKQLLSDVENKIEILYTSSKKIWEDLLNFDNFTQSIKSYILDYLSYKSIKTIFNYQHFWKEYFNNKCIYEYLIENNSSKEEIDELMLKIISEEFNTTKNINHMNLKIVQCLNYLNNKKFSKRVQEDFYISIKEFEDYLSQQKESYSYDDIFINMLPSIFSTEILYKKRIKKSDGSFEYLHNIKLSEMSSGEQQLLFTLSYIIYHIKNIESITDENRTTYENISIIIDEAELYYHPEFQRIYLSELIKILKRSQLSTIKNVNIIIATHSPFIISDIPCFNIMGLENGHTRAFNKATLGANIYDLFRKQFFMTSSLGKISCDIFNDIITDYYTFKENSNDDGDVIKLREIITKYTNKLDDYKILISQIGDDYYQRTIGKMIFRMCKMNENEIYKELKDLCEE